MSSIPLQEWYTGKSILVTGGTGFMGKVLLEKLLRALPGIKYVYVLMRPKRNLTPSDRIKTLSNLPLFDTLLRENKDALRKLIPIDADMGADNLGISVKDKGILVENVNVVFHMAATLRLEADVKDAIVQNTLGTLRLLEICREFKKLESFVHLSTAFCHCDVDVLEEKVYRPTKDPYEVIKLVQTKTDAEMKQIETELMAPHPNSYIFSKRLAEAIVNDMANTLPVAIARPSIVLPTLSDPVPGWVDSLNGPVGVFVAAGKGVLRTMMCDPEAHAEVIPVDTGINALISIAWKRGTGSFSSIPVYNVTSADRMDITWGEVLDKGKRIIAKYPFEWTLWYPGGGATTNRLVHNLIIIFCHYLPAYFIDFLLFLFGQKRFMVRVQNRISLGLHLLEYFTLRDWKFRTANTIDLETNYTKEELEKFPISSATYEVDDYMTKCLVGTRKYCVKENVKSIPRCRMYVKFLYYLDWAVKIVALYFLTKWTLQLVGLPFTLNSDFLTNGRFITYVK